MQSRVTEHTLMFPLCSPLVSTPAPERPLAAPRRVRSALDLFQLDGLNPKWHHYLPLGSLEPQPAVLSRRSILPYSRRSLRHAPPDHPFNQAPPDGRKPAPCSDRTHHYCMQPEV